MKNMLMRILFLLSLSLVVVGCTNTSSQGGNSLGSLNDAYNRKNGTEGRSMILDTLIATTLYNHPEIIPTYGKVKTKSKTKTDINSTSNTISNSQYFSNGNSSFSQNESVTTTKVRSKSKTKSITTGVGVSPNLDFYLK